MGLLQTVQVASQPESVARLWLCLTRISKPHIGHGFVRSQDVETELQPRVAALRAAGMTPAGLTKLARMNPNCLLMDLEHGLRPRLSFLSDAGFSGEQVSARSER